MGKEQIIKKMQSSKVKKFLQDRGIAKLSLFGSYAKGEAVRGSDVDFLFVEKKGVLLSLFQLVEVMNFLKKVLRKNVDLVDRGYIRPELKKEILSHEIDVL